MLIWRMSHAIASPSVTWKRRASTCPFFWIPPSLFLWDDGRLVRQIIDTGNHNYLSAYLEAASNWAYDLLKISDGSDFTPTITEESPVITQSMLHTCNCLNSGSETAQPAQQYLFIIKPRRNLHSIP